MSKLFLSSEKGGESSSEKDYGRQEGEQLHAVDMPCEGCINVSQEIKADGTAIQGNYNVSRRLWNLNSLTTHYAEL